MPVSDKKRTQLTEDLSPVLMQGEEVIDATTCLAYVRRMGQTTQRRGTLFVTDRRVGVFTKKLGGYDLLDFAYGLLTSVEYKRGMLYGEITLLAAGEHTEVRQIQKDEVERIAQGIRQRVALAHSHAPAGVPPSPAAGGVADELMKLSQLRESGVLSEEEFQAQKAKLLGS